MGLVMACRLIWKLILGSEISCLAKLLDGWDDLWKRALGYGGLLGVMNPNSEKGH